MRATMRRGLCFRRTSEGERPSRSRTPGRNGSIRTSAVERMERRSLRDEAFRRSTVMDVLRRVSWSFEIALGRSMRRTEAP